MGVVLIAVEGLDAGLLATAFTLGLRHGVDADHIAAISDLAANQPKARDSMGLATVYAAGHAWVVVALGSIAVLAGDTLPAGFDAIMGRLVGATLLLLGGYVVIGLVRQGRDFQLRSRWAVVASLLQAMSQRIRRQSELVIWHDHDHGPHHGHHHVEAAPTPGGSRSGAATATTHRHAHVHIGSLPPDPSPRRGAAAFTIGMLHGVGAETPTQVLLFVAAAGASGALIGEVALLVFAAGLLVANTAIAIAAAAGFLHAGRHGVVYIGIALTTAAFSLVLGTLYVLGIDAAPPLVG